ncbi:MAG: hypothetical protein P8Z81_05220 [Deinococcales bacterium]
MMPTPCAPVHAGRVDWQALESCIPLDDLPAFHRAFLEHIEPDEDWQAAFLRRVQGKVQAALKRLLREGAAGYEGGRYWLDVELVPDAFRGYLMEE